MPGPTHEVPLGLLAEHPERLSALLERPVVGTDRQVRRQGSGRTALSLRQRGPPRELALLELHLDPDVRKRLRWPLAVAQVSDARRAACDLVVLTPVRACGRWWSTWGGS